MKGRRLRPKVIQLIDDAKLGGVNIALESLAASKLNHEFHSFKEFTKVFYERF